MYSKIAVLLVVKCILVLAEDNCDCSGLTLEQSITESNDIVEFFNKIEVNGETEDEKYPVVPPGLLTGALGCQCENLRRKRKIFPNEGIPVESQERVIPPRFAKRNCPVGSVWVERACMKEEDLYKK